MIRDKPIKPGLLVMVHYVIAIDLLLALVLGLVAFSLVVIFGIILESIRNCKPN